MELRAFGNNKKRTWYNSRKFGKIDYIFIVILLIIVAISIAMVKVNGQVKGFDSYIIMLEDEKRQQNMIYKHAVSTIQPSRHINMQNNNQQNNGFNK